MTGWIRREAVYLWYYLDIQIRQIAPYWAMGILLGSAISVFGKNYIHGAFSKLGKKRAGWLIRAFYGRKNGSFFDFTGFHEGESRDTDPNMLLRFLKNVGRNVRATGPMFLLGILLTALYQIHVPPDLVSDMFGKDNGFGVLMAATIGVPLYMCGGFHDHRPCHQDH